MKLGIVGHGQEKFDARTEYLGRYAMFEYVTQSPVPVTKIISGHSPMGGVDIWAEELAKDLGIFDPDYIFAPERFTWGGPGGYRERNLKIADAADLVLCVVVKELPADYTGMRFTEGCYHCKGRNGAHVKSGGCWTAWHCKQRTWRIIE